VVTGCSQGPAAPPPSAVEVDVTHPITGTVTDSEEFTGRLDALKTVDIRAHVSGYIKEAPFKEGDEVNKDDLLFQIDPATFEADRNQAQANVKLAEADRNLQQRIADRDRTLVGSRSIGLEEYETQLATAKKSAANVKALEAALARAQQMLDYTHVTAPWSGRISRRQVDPGNMVVADNTILTTMVTEDPLYAYFDVDERTYLNLVQSGLGMRELVNTTKASGKGPEKKDKEAKDKKTKPDESKKPESDLGFPVLMRLANEADFNRMGKINFIDNRVNAATGTIRMRGEFPNSERTLKPGLFARIQLPTSEPYQAILIPDEALVNDQGKKVVYVVNDKDEVEYRTVTLGQEIQGLRVIKKGIGLGDRVIVTGMQRVRKGSTVKPREQKPPSQPESKLSELLASLRQSRGRSQETNKQPGKPGDQGMKAAKDKSAPADRENAKSNSSPVPAGN
jgi:RND family efflux transporter MFP subunit